MRNTLLARLTGTVGLLLGAGLFAATVHQAGLVRNDVEDAELARIRLVAVTLAPRVDGGVHETFAARYPGQDDVAEWTGSDRVLQELRRPLVEALAANGITTPIYTLRLRDDMRAAVLAAPDLVHPDAMEFLLTTSEAPYWRHTYQYKPQMGPTLFQGTAGIVPAYEDEHGTWISAYAPVRSPSGEVTAILEVDARLDDLIAAARTQALQLLAALVVVFLFVVVVFGVAIGRMTRSLTELSYAAAKLGSGDLDSGFGTPRTTVSEVRTLAATLESSRLRLKALVAELREREARLAVAVAVARAATQTKSDFLASMSHELRTPLNAILGYSELVLEELEHEPRAIRSDVQMIRSAGTNLLALIDDLLDLAKIEAGRMEAQATTVSVSELLREVADTIRPTARRNGNALDLLLAPHLGSIRTDAARLKQILLNLLANASKFTEHGVIELLADRRNVDGQDTLEVTIQDTGIGMTHDQIVRVFEPFVQADRTIAGRYGGTGLGLTLARRFARLLGGELTASSELGKGSRFVVSVPCHMVERRATPHLAGERLHDGRELGA